MMDIPRPLPDTINISTNSRLLLKYCATISVEQSLVKLTPTPVKINFYIFNIKIVSCFQHLLCKCFFFPPPFFLPSFCTRSGGKCDGRVCVCFSYFLFHFVLLFSCFEKKFFFRFFRNAKKRKKSFQFRFAFIEFFPFFLPRPSSSTLLLKNGIQ